MQALASCFFLLSGVFGLLVGGILFCFGQDR